MAEEIERSRGRPSNYKQDRGGVPAEYGPYVGRVMNNIDPARLGRLQVFIEAFNAGSDNQDQSKWTTVSYMPPFYGVTPPGKTADNDSGTYPGNPNSYGMWFTPPDLGLQVMCVFINGDRSQGYYIGVLPENGLTHMIPAIGAESNYVTTNANQESYFADAPLLPVTELNSNNNKLDNAGRFFDQAKPVQSVVAASLFQQGLAKDTERGPIRSSSQRESPSAVFGISTPGTAIYQGGLKPADIRQKLNSGAVKPAELEVIGRMGGHTFVMDDGDINGRNQLFRLRSAKGHQFMMNDSNNFIYLIHANGQTWIELGQEGTIDVYSTNSVNVRSQGDVNIHADQDINMYAGRNFNIKAKNNFTVEAGVNASITAQADLKLYSKATIGVKADGTLALESASGSWAAGSGFVVSAGGIDFNGPAAPAVDVPKELEKVLLDSTTFSTSKGWEVEKDKLETIVPRAPTHEPWPYHNAGVAAELDFEEGQPDPPPGAEPVPAGVEIVKTA
jgi:hypothetical protein